MLDDLSSPAGIGLEPCLERFILVTNLDGAIPFGFPCTGERQTPFFGLIRAGEFDDFGVEHDRCGSVIIEDDDALGHADHVGRHTHAAGSVGLECIAKILRDGQILFRRRNRFPGKKERVFHYWFNHRISTCY